MTFRPKWNYGPLYLLAATLVVGALAALFLRGALRSAVGPGAFVLLLLALLLAPLLVALVAYGASFALLAYRVERNGLLISAGLFHLYVPMAEIQGIYTAPSQFNPFRVRGLRFPGHNIAAQSTPQGGPIVYLATAAAADCLYVTTAKRTYAISPARPEQFLRAYESERQLGPVRQWHESVRVAAVLQTLVWRDHLGRGLAIAALAAGFVLLAFAFWRYPDLPASIPMHFDALGRPDRMEPPANLFYLPLIGSVVTLVNFSLAILLYSRERLLSYFLWGGAGLVQVLLIMALRVIAG